MVFGWRRNSKPAASADIEHSGYVDVHCHILPGLDDGARDIEESLALAKAAVANGISDIVATPHLNPDLFEFSPEKAQTALERLRAALAEAHIPIAIHSGAEVRANPAIINGLNTPEVPSLADGSFLLLEFPFERIPVFARDLIFKLQTAGVTPVLAHPERNVRIQQEPQVLEPYLAAGVQMQVNSTSLTGELGKTSRKTAITLLEKDYIHMIGSDSHGTGRRGPNFKEAVMVAAKYVGIEKAQALVRENPRQVLSAHQNNG